MEKWHVCVTFDASYVYEVEAETKQEALDLGLQAARTPNLCNQCSRHLDLGDPLEAVDAWRQ